MERSFAKALRGSTWRFRRQRTNGSWRAVRIVQLARQVSGVNVDRKLLEPHRHAKSDSERHPRETFTQFMVRRYGEDLAVLRQRVGMSHLTKDGFLRCSRRVNTYEISIGHRPGTAELIISAVRCFMRIPSLVRGYKMP